MIELIDKYSQLITYIGGIITGFVPFYIKASIAKNNLIILFMTDIEKNWRNFDQLQHVFAGEWIARATLSFRGYDNLNISDEVEYRFEICNIKMYETEGIKLLPLLGRQARLILL